MVKVKIILVLQDTCGLVLGFMERSIELSRVPCIGERIVCLDEPDAVDACPVTEVYWQSGGVPVVNCKFLTMSDDDFRLTVQELTACGWVS